MSDLPSVPRRSHRRLVAAEWAYAAAVVAVLVALRVGGDRWGWATVLAYGPRATVLAPAVVLLPVAVVRRRRWPWLTTGTVLLALVGVLGFTVPSPRLLAPPKPAASLRVLELNADGGGEDSPGYDHRRLADLVAVERPDVLLLAEWPAGDVPPGGPWDVRQSADVAIASHTPIGRTATWSAGPLGGEGTSVACRLTVAGRPLWCVGLHLETPRRGLEPILRRQPGASRLLAESTARRRRLSASAAAFVRDTAGGDDVLVGGDFNEVGDGVIFGDTWGDRPDAFAAAGWGFGWTKYQWGWGVRIDHVVVGGRWHARRCRVGPDVGSDHRPLIADIDAVVP